MSTLDRVNNVYAIIDGTLEQKNMVVSGIKAFYFVNKAFNNSNNINEQQIIDTLNLINIDDMFISDLAVHHLYENVIKSVFALFHSQHYMIDLRIVEKNTNTSFEELFHKLRNVYLEHTDQDKFESHMRSIVDMYFKDGIIVDLFEDDFMRFEKIFSKREITNNLYYISFSKNIKADLYVDESDNMFTVMNKMRNLELKLSDVKRIF